MEQTVKLSKPLKLYFQNNYPFNIILVGCGGTGSFIAQDLARIAYHLKSKGADSPKITFVDFDIVEAKNVGRQNFVESEIGQYKAQTLAVRYNLAYGLEIAYFNDLLNKRQVRQNPGEEYTLVIGAVDNTAGRASIKALLEKTKMDYAHVCRSDAWLDCGNSEASGQVLFGNAFKPAKEQDACAKLGLCVSVPLPHIQHPEIIKKQPKPRLSCAELAEAETQSLMVNRAIATFAAQYLYDILVKRMLTKYATYIGLSGCSADSNFLNPDIWGGKK